MAAPLLPLPRRYRVSASCPTRSRTPGARERGAPFAFSSRSARHDYSRAAKSRAREQPSIRQSDSTPRRIRRLFPLASIRRHRRRRRLDASPPVNSIKRFHLHFCADTRKTIFSRRRRALSRPTRCFRARLSTFRSPSPPPLPSHPFDVASRLRNLRGTRSRALDRNEK